MYICVLSVILALCASSLFARENLSAEAALDRASYFANLYNWAAAAPYFADAKEQFTRAGDQRNALYAALGETRATIERRNLLRTAAELQIDLDGNQFLQSDKGLRLFCLIIKGDVDIEINSRAARHDWEQVRALSAETGNARWQNRALAQIGVAAFYDGDSETAGRDIGTALAIATKAKDIAAQIRFTTMLGIGFLENSMYERSEPYFDHALELAKTLPDVGYPFLVQESRVKTLIGLKQYDTARQLTDEILKQLSSKSHEGVRAELLPMSAQVALSRGDIGRAISNLNEAINLCNKHGFEHLLPEPEAMLGEIYRRQNRFKEAEQHASAAASATQTSGYTWAVPARLQLLAEIQVDEGQYTDADRSFDRAQAFIDSAVANSPSILQKTGLIQSSSDIYAEHFDLLVSKLRNTQKAYRVIEEVRGRVTADLLVAGSTHSPQARRTEQSISRLELELMDSKSNQEVSDLRNQIFTAEQVRWITPGVSILKSQVRQTIEPKRIQQTLDRSTLLLEYVIAEPHSYCLVLSRSSLRVVPLAGANTINDLVHTYLKAVNAKLPAHGESVAIFNSLVRPIQEIASSSNMVVIRDGELHLLPFDALEESEGKYMAASKIVTYAPSITSFYLLTLQSNRAPSQFHSLLAVGGVPYSGAVLKNKVSTQGLPESGMTELPFSREEVLAAEAAVRGEDKILTGSLATESAFKDDAGKGFNVIHLAVHGVSNSANPDDAYLALLPDKTAHDDGLLHASEIAMMRLHTNVVVLSACDTAVGTLQGEEGISTISESFLLAGASSVISTLWSVDDTSSLFLMKRFYSHLENGELPGTALAAAKREMLHTFGKSAVPYYWAGFTFEGALGRNARG